MNFKRTAVVLGLMLLAIAGLIIYALNQPDDGSVSERLFPGFVGVKADDIDSFEIVRTRPQDEKLVFTRDPKTKRWNCTSPAPALLDSNMIDSIVGSIVNLKPVEYPSLTADSATHGLDQPTVTLTVRQGSARSAVLNLGLTTIGGENAVTFVSMGANAGKPLAVRQSAFAGLYKDAVKSDGPAWSIVKSLTEFRSTRIFGHGPRDFQLDVKSLRVKAGPREIKLESAGPQDWTFAVPAGFGDADIGGDREINPDRFTGVKPMLNYFATLQVASASDFIESPSPKDLEKYGLKGDEAALRIELTDSAGSTNTLYIGKVDEADPSKRRFVRKDGDSCVARLAIDRFDSLLRTVGDPTDMRNRDVIASPLFPSIDGLDFTVSGQTFKLRRYGKTEAQKWYLVGGPADPSEANNARIDQWLQAVTRPRWAVGFPNGHDESAYAGAELKATVTIWRNAMKDTVLPETGKPTPEPPTAAGATSVTLAFGKAEGGNLRLRKTDGKAVNEFLVPAAFLPLLPKSRLDLLAPSLPFYPTNTVSRLILERPTGPVDLSKDAKPDPAHPLGKWTFAKPDERKGQLADQPKVDGLIGLLPVFQVNSIIAERPTDEQLKSFGFAPPRFKVTVEIAGSATQQRTYEFGNETADRNFVYARHGAGSLIYTVPKADVDRLLNEDLRDSELYRVNIARLTGLTIKGWTNRLPIPPAHEYKRTGEAWSCVSPKDAVADPNRINAILNHITQPRAVKFLGPIKPEHQLDPGKGAIEITLVQDGSPPITLTLGAEIDGGLHYAAMSSTRPGEAVTIPANAIRLFAGTPEGLLMAKPDGPVPEKKAP
jgi:hypothetical protein